MYYLRMTKRRKPRKPPELEVTDALIKEVGMLGGHGLLLTDIRNYYGFGAFESSWFTLLKKHPRMVDAWIEGRAKTGAWVAQQLINKMKQGNVAAMIFYLKTQMHWVEKHSLEVTSPEKPDLIPLKLGKDPIKATKAYQKIMR